MRLSMRAALGEQPVAPGGGEQHVGGNLVFHALVFEEADAGGAGLAPQGGEHGGGGLHRIFGVRAARHDQQRRTAQAGGGSALGRDAGESDAGGKHGGVLQHRLGGGGRAHREAGDVDAVSIDGVLRQQVFHHGEQRRQARAGLGGQQAVGGGRRVIGAALGKLRDQDIGRKTLAYRRRGPGHGQLA